MRRLRYNVAASLDGFIAGPLGDYDWIVHDTSIDFAALFAEFDLFVMGRKTYDALRAQGERDPTLGRKVVVASRSLTSVDRTDVEIISQDIAARVAALKAQPGKDIWLFGGGELARTLFDAKLVDTVEVAVMPVLLCAGVPLLPPGGWVRLALESSVSLPSGIQMLRYRTD
jgi:dihydrofolate reductase